MRSALEKLPPGILLGSDLAKRRQVLALSEPFASYLPDGGLPRGAVTEIRAPLGLAKSHALALRACAAAQSESRLRGGESAWCAFLDPGSVLYAPALLGEGVCLERLLVVRPPWASLARLAVRIAESHVFSVVVIDTAAAPGAQRSAASLAAWARVVRRLALGVQQADTAVILLTDSRSARALPLPTALRIELDRPAPSRLSLQVAKERHGRIGPVRHISYPEGHELHAGLRKAPASSPFAKADAG